MKMVLCTFCDGAFAYASSGLPEIEAALGGWTGWTQNVSDWCCQECLAQGRAIRADPTRQRQILEFGQLVFSYWDIPAVCFHCRQPYVFSAAEQQYRYEQAGLPLEVECRGCSACRGRIRRRKAEIERIEALPEPRPLSSLSGRPVELARNARWMHHLQLVQQLRQRPALEPGQATLGVGWVENPNGTLSLRRLD